METQKPFSKPVDDPAIQRLLNWVVQNGGKHKVCVREDKNGVRGLYSAQDFNTEDNPIATDDEDADTLLKIPNKLLVTPYHVANLHYLDAETKQVKYNDVFEKSPEIFDPKFKYKANHVNKAKIENEFAEYFQLTLFLLAERLKKENSEFEPFISYLPKEIQTLYSYPDDTKIHPESDKTLLSEIQYDQDDIFSKIKQDREFHLECKQRFMTYLRDNAQSLNSLSGGTLDFENLTETDFDWAWMNVGTRCFGTHHFPASIAMVPLVDLINHSVAEDEKMRFYIYPLSLGIKMVERGDTMKVNTELEWDYVQEDNKEGFQDMRDEWESQDLDQHWDDYGDAYYNYYPRPQKPKIIDSDEEPEPDEDKYIQLDPIEKIWPLDNDKIFICKKLLNKRSTQIREGEELHISYGERANSFLIIEYGFTVPDNRYDFVRIKDINIDQINQAAEQANIQGMVLPNHQILRNLEQYRMKDTIRIDLKLSGLHRDLLRLIRSCIINDENKSLKTDIEVLKLYMQIVKQRLSLYPTTLAQDIALLERVQKDQTFHWIYQYVIIYRLGQKRILERQLTLCELLIKAILAGESRFDDEVKILTMSSNMDDVVKEMKSVYGLNQYQSNNLDNKSEYLFDPNDGGLMPPKSPVGGSQQKLDRLLGSPVSLEQIQFNIKQEIERKKQRNEANQKLQNFKKLLQKQDVGGQLTTSSEKIAMIPSNLREDYNEAVLYCYYAVRYYDEHIFKVIVTRTSQFQNDRNLYQLLGRDRCFQQLTLDTSYSRFRLNQLAFDIAIDKDYVDVAFHFIETGQSQITWEIVRKMLARRQEYLVKQCIKYGSKFDPGSASLKKIVFAGRSAAPLEDRTIKLVDFIQVMLELKWRSKEIKEVLINYQKKGKIDSVDLRELFLMFAVKRKIKLMSMLINSDQFAMEFTEDHFIDVLENDAYDMGVLLYREYFLQLQNQTDKFLTILVNAFTKSNGLLEAKCFLIKKFMQKISYEQAQKLLINIEQRVNDSSKGNILILTLNVVKASCLLIEILENVRKSFNFLNRRVYEIRSKLVKVAQKFMDEVTSEEEMRFYLLEKDLDERDALNVIFDCQIIELLENPYAQNIVRQIWESQYNNSHSLFTTSTVHKLMFEYNHCRYDMEEQMRFYRSRDLQKFGCHPFQFQVWRYSGESRYLVQSLTTMAFFIIFHLVIVGQMNYSDQMLAGQDNYKYWQTLYRETQDPTKSISPEQVALRTATYRQLNLRNYDFMLSAMRVCYLCHLQWMFIFQHMFNVIFAYKNKRSPHLLGVSNFLDVMLLFISLLYIFSAYRGWRYDTYLEVLTNEQIGERYWNNYINSVVNENTVLLIYGILMWCRVFYQLKLMKITAAIFTITEKMFVEMFTYAIFYFSVLFLFGVLGFVLFYDIDDFKALNTALFTLFKASIQMYDVDQMKEARVGAFLGYSYFLAFLILNLILIINLIVARLANVYKQYANKKHLLVLLNTLFVREVSEADDKYSSLVSSYFPLNMLQFLLGSLTISMKSPAMNVAILNLYYLPISLTCLVIFSVYQVVLMPFCYIKMVGHKFALMVKQPEGAGARSFLDRFFHGILFFALGPIFLGLNCIVDIFWFMVHMYKMDLDKSHLQVQVTVDLHRRTYKRMIRYFEMKNEQLVPQKRVAEDLRHYLDIQEGLKCMIYGKPKEVPHEKLGIYAAYGRAYMKESENKKNVFELQQFVIDDDIDIVEHVNAEYNVVKQVLLNNSFPVDLREIQQNNVKKKGWGMRLLFDKKTFHQLLVDLERMRKVLNLKKSFYIFHIPYEGKPSEMDSWHRKVERRITQTLKFLNTARTLKIIGYDPTYHIKGENIEMAMVNGAQGNLENLDLRDSQQFLSMPKFNKPVKSAQVMQEDENLNTNFQFMMAKYSAAAKQMKDMAEIIGKISLQSNMDPSKQQLLKGSQSQPVLTQPMMSKKAFKSDLKYDDFSDDELQEGGITNKGKINGHNQQLDMSFHNPDVNYDSQLNMQKQIIYKSPSKVGVIGQQPPKISTSGTKANRYSQKDYQELSQSEAVATSDNESVENDDGPKVKFNKEQDDPNGAVKRKK